MSQDSVHTSHSVVVVRDFLKEHLPSMIDNTQYLTAVVGDVIDVIYEPESCVNPQRTWIYGRKREAGDCGWLPSTYTVMLNRGTRPLYELSYEDQLWLENRCLTRFIENAINYLLRDRRYAVEGIFRCSGDKRMESWIMAHVARAGSINFEHVPGITAHSVADTIKFYLKKLPESIIPPRLWTQFNGFLLKYKDSTVLQVADFPDIHLQISNQGFDYTACRRDVESLKLLADEVFSKAVGMNLGTQEKYAFLFSEDSVDSSATSSLFSSEDTHEEPAEEPETLSLQPSPMLDSTLSEQTKIVADQTVCDKTSLGFSTTSNAANDSVNEELFIDAAQEDGAYQSYEYNPLGSYGVGPYYHAQQMADDITGTDEGCGSTDNSTELLLEDCKGSPSPITSIADVQQSSSSARPFVSRNPCIRENKGEIAADFIFRVLPLSRFILLRSIMILCCHIMDAIDVTKMTPQSFKQVFYMCILNDPNNNFSISVSQKVTEFLFTNWPLFEKYYNAIGIPFFDPAIPLSRCKQMHKAKHTSMQGVLIYVLTTFDPTDYIGISNSISCIKIWQNEVVALVRTEGKWALVDTGPRQGWVDLACLQHNGLFCLAESSARYELDSPS
ncbi:Rho GAP, putative [Giardia lamblia P15]|uniref:Rho GAP, putative n=1 Tax=Giardia intestinalis (strain P15) TaxID=658858 RepID=E1F8X3_GIAIA|nr:Rho GAP, putative [Giardia lamblia P15]